MPGTRPGMTATSVCESLQVPVRLPWIERTQAMFHSKCFTPKKLDFKGLENSMNQFADRA
jgi:hypothetical protein